MSRQLTTEKFIIKAKEVHNNKYDYSLVNYQNNQTKIIINCPIHGIFEQKPSKHLSGQTCKKCATSTVNLLKKKTNLKFIEESVLIHDNKYDYSISNYQNAITPINIICPIHGEFKQIPSTHLKGKGCPKCAGKNKTTSEYIKEVNLTHNSMYDYSLVKYENSLTKINIICPIHGIFEQTPNAHLSGHGCSICKESKGEKEITKFLIENKIKFIKQHTFDDCKNIKKLPFDFYLPEYNICVEFNGEQHYKPIKHFGGLPRFKKQLITDKIKNDYCINNNLKLLIISYNENVFKSLNLFFNNFSNCVKTQNLCVMK
jgi:hypothetical protein